jgi:hypothetical protein
MSTLQITNRWRRLTALCSVAVLLAAGMPGKSTFGDQHSCSFEQGDCSRHHSCTASRYHCPSEHALAGQPEVHFVGATLSHVGSTSVGSSCACWTCGCGSHSACPTNDNQLPGACHGPACPACPSCPTCPGCCHCSVAQVICIATAVLPVLVDQNLNSGAAEAPALYSSPCHGRTTPPPKA